MTKRMLIDATHAEETRVAVALDDNRLDDFDFENKVRKTLRGNIYLVKVTRVEPSLQAAFVDFGGNRHGFLPFPEIHPDYYRIPIADREKLIAEHEAEAEVIEEVEGDDEEDEAQPKARKAKAGDDKDVEFVGGEEDIDDTPTFKRSNIKHRYKIQEVIKRNQIMLIQVNKEERGNKGAAVSTYISLPGRYCVLMPNSPRAGGVSRKVSNAADRQRLKKTLADLKVPQGMSVIIRTAGISRTKAEIKRDFEYLMRLWDKIRDLTLKSTAPELVHEEGDLIKRAIRDLYRRDINEILVEGEEGYKRARDFMKMLMPSHAKNVKQYKAEDGVPMFFRYQVEKQIDEIYSINVRLKSGGYIVINPTEALISIDVNSGKATKGRHIEETALKTNVEAAEEVARQLRLRDLGGLVVIDFIDMEDYKNNRIVERHLKEAMQRDRARIQFGRISAFGLLELSRQRMRPSLVETNFEVCDHCHGIGVVRTVETSAAVALRAIEEEGLRGRADEICVTMNTAVALYIFNNKRQMLADIEQKYGMRVQLEADAGLIKPEYNIQVVSERDTVKPLIDLSEPVFDKTSDISYGDDDGDNGERHPRRRRSRRGGRNRRGRRKDTPETGDNGQIQDQAPNGDTDVQADRQNGDTADQKKTDTVEGAEKKSTRGRRSSRGGRRQGKAVENNENGTSVSQVAAGKSSNAETVASAEITPDKPKAEKKEPAAAKKTVKRKPAKATDDKPAAAKSDTPDKTADKTAGKPVKTRKNETVKAEVVNIEPRQDIESGEGRKAASDNSPSGEGDKAESGKKGWWQRLTD